MLLRRPVHTLKASRCAHALPPRASPTPRPVTSPHLVPIVPGHRRRLYSAQAVKHSPHQHVAVLGGGVTGLASAYYLLKRQPTAKVTLYEAKDRIGGWLESHRVPVDGGSVLFEAGPRTLRPQNNGILAVSLMQELDLAKDAIFTQRSSPAARNRFVYYPDHLVRMPHPSQGIFNIAWALASEPVFESAVWSALTEPWKNPRDPGVQDESIGEFFSRRLDKRIVDRLISAVIHGIYAGDVWQLSARSLFSRPWRDETLFGSLMLGAMRGRAEGLDVTQREANFVQEMKDYSWDPLLKATMRDNSVFTFKEGLKMMSERLYAKLFETGRVEFKTSSQVTEVKQAQGNTGIQVRTRDSKEPSTHSHVISALSPWHLNAITHSSSGNNLIPSIPSVTVMTVNLYFRTPNLHEPGFGYLIPQATPFESNPERALGVVFDNGYSPGPSDVNPANWNAMSMDQLKQARESGQLVNVNDFGWYNMPDKPNTQDQLETRGTKVTVMLGGHWWNDWPAFPDEQEGLSMARSVLERHLGIKEEPEAWKVNLQKDCIPQYTVGHEQRLKQAHNNIWREYKGRLRVAGNWMSGVGVNDCLRSAYEVAKNLSKDGTGLEQIGEAPTVKVKLQPGGKAEGVKK
ncbi:Protoporphyrinogen oxidase [Lecanosticta acicola]|uniref:Protoporphyrinogen oxidase n=1 Tax=Lecanosticta acicola TaxID=111012 RepID=A0AAI8YZR5_9PEZI|nr:Protoporphyrinogen oxidase [Lecanosticta acicola]